LYEKIDAVDELRQGVGADAVEAALRAYQAFAQARGIDLVSTTTARREAVSAAIRAALESRARELAAQLQDCVDLVTVDPATGMQRYIMDANGIEMLRAALASEREAALREAIDAKTRDPDQLGHLTEQDQAIYWSGVRRKEIAIRALATPAAPSQINSTTGSPYSPAEIEAIQALPDPGVGRILRKVADPSPDPGVALAKLFRNLMHQWSDTTEQAMIGAGLLDEEEGELTDLGRAAMRLAERGS